MSFVKLDPQLYYWWESEILSKSYGTKSKAFKAKGKIRFIYDNTGLIFDYQVIFNYLEIDILTTDSWFNKPSANFLRRKILFEKLNLSAQIPRKKYQKEKGYNNKLIKLNKQKLKTLNQYLQNDYDSTLKNITALLKSNNPGGELLNSESAELVILNNDNQKENFAIMFSEIQQKGKKFISESDKVSFRKLIYDNEHLKINYFEEVKQEIKDLFNLFNGSQNKFILKSARKNLNQWSENKLNIAEKIEKIISDSRKKYVNNIGTKLVFENVEHGYERAHIYPVAAIKKEMIAHYKNKKHLNKLQKMIEDPENYLNLPDALHKNFDNNFFTYKNNGNSFIINWENKKYKFEDVINKDESLKIYWKKCKSISSNFLTPNRKLYINKRNELIESKYNIKIQ